MSQRGENIYKRKDGRYEGRYVIGKKKNGKTKFGYVYGLRYVDVKQKLTLLKAAAGLVEKSSEIYGDGTVRMWAEYWLEVECRPENKASTYAAYRGQIQKHILPLLGEYPLSGINDDAISLLIGSMKTHLGNGTIQNVCRLFFSMLSLAQERGLLKKMPSSKPWKKLRNRRAKPRYLTQSEQLRLERAALGSDSLEVILALYTGLRLGEICALKWENIDFDEGCIHVTHTLQRVRVYERGKKTALLYMTPKSDTSERDIPLPVFLLDMLQTHFERNSRQAADFIFGEQNKPAEPRTMQYRFHRLVKQAGLRGVHFHTLRHTFATRCLEKGFDIGTLCEILGHSSAKVTLDFYTHSTPTQKKKSMHRLQMAG